jgi:hypothetical protein
MSARQDNQRTFTGENNSAKVGIMFATAISVLLAAWFVRAQIVTGAAKAWVVDHFTCLATVAYRALARAKSSSARGSYFQIGPSIGASGGRRSRSAMRPVRADIVTASRGIIPP